MCEKKSREGGLRLYLCARSAEQTDSKTPTDLEATAFHLASPSETERMVALVRLASVLFSFLRC